MYIPYAPVASCESIAKYINSMYKNKYTFIDSAEFIVAIVDILERIGNNYNPDLGHLNRYAKNTLTLKMKEYVVRKHKYFEELTGDEATNLSLTDIDLSSIDLSKYPDKVIVAIYKVVNGTGGKRALQIIRDTFKVKE